MQGIESAVVEDKGIPSIRMSEDFSNTKKRGAKTPLVKINYLRISYRKLMKYFFFHHVWTYTKYIFVK